MKAAILVLVPGRITETNVLRNGCFSQTRQREVNRAHSEMQFPMGFDSRVTTSADTVVP